MTQSKTNQIHNCIECKISFKTPGELTQHKYKNNHYNCHYCGVLLKKYSYYCSNECKYNDKLKKLNKNSNPTWPICKECGRQAKSLQYHIQQIHKMTIIEYKDKYNCDNSSIYSQETRDKLSKAMQGSNNPGYQHGGKLSSWSKKSEYYNLESHKKAISKLKRSNQKEYWFDKGYSENEAILKICERQKTFSLNKCVAKYGEIEGTKRWKVRQEKWLATIASKPIEELERINALKGTGLKSSVSKESILFFNSIIDYLNTINIHNYLSDKNELQIYYNNYNYYRYDFTIPELKLIIEYNGALWHPRKDRLKENFESWKHPFVSSMDPIEKEKKDLHKIEIAKINGYKILEIWSDDKDKLDIAINFIKENNVS